MMTEAHGPASELLTTGQVARLCGFSPSAVLKWIRAGKLPTYSTPGGQYRVPRRELCRFLKRYRMHVPPELTSLARHRIVIFAGDGLVHESLARMLKGSALDCEIERVEDGILGCMRIPELRPHLILFDLTMRKPDGADLCRAVKACKALSNTKILVIVEEPDSVRVNRVLMAGADGWIAKPVTFEALMAKVTMLLGTGPRAGALTA